MVNWLLKKCKQLMKFKKQNDKYKKIIFKIII